MASIEEILAVLRNEDQPYPARIDSLEALLSYDDPCVVEAVLGALTSAERYLRRKAAEVLTRYHQPRVIDALALAATKDSDEAVRRNAVRSLGVFGDPSAMDALYRATKDESLVVSKEAKQVIEKLRGARAEVARDRPRRESGGVGTRPVVERAARDIRPEPSMGPPPEPAPTERRPRRPSRRHPPEPERKVEPTAPGAAQPEPAPPPEVQPAAVTPPRTAKGYVPPALARLPALRGLSASEELGWPDLLDAFALARGARNMILSALGLALALGGCAGLAFVFGVDASAPSLAGLRRPGLFVGAAALWTWLVLSAIGFKVARNAAVELATGQQPTIGQVYGFWLGRLTYPYRPAIVGAVLLAIPVGLIVLTGYLSTLDVVGEFIEVVAYPLCLFFGGIAVLILLGLAAGMPLMVPTMVVENTGCSDAITSSWAFIFTRPWRYALYWLAALVHCVFVVALVVVSVYAAEAGIALGAGRAVSFDLFEHLAPGATPLGVFHSVLLFMLGSYVLSHYFTSRVGIYLLMRKAVDGIDIDTIYIPKKKGCGANPNS